MNDVSPAVYRWKLLSGGDFWLDAGTMFGLIPRTIWGKLVETDEANRMAMTTNCLLLEPVDPGRVKGPILIEAGSGDKFDQKMRAIYRMDGTGIADSLRAAGVAPAAIAHVVLSHLHFDHVGGMTRLSKPGETPDWTDAKTGAAVQRVFPHATVHADQREWEDALANRSVMTRTYLPENLHPLREQMKLFDAPPPFPPGAILRRNAIPAAPWRERAVEVLPGIFALNVPGHTPGQCAIGFTDESGQTVVYCPDVMPMRYHVGAAYNLAYDAEAYLSMLCRQWFLAAAAEENWLVVLTHEPNTPVMRVRPSGTGWFTLHDASRVSAAD